MCGRSWVTSPTMWWVIGSILLPVTIPFLIYEYLQRLRVSLMRRKLEGKVVLITGASSGLGEALAHSFYKSGCKIILASRREGELERVRTTLLETHHTTPTYPPVVLPLDLSDVNSLQKQAQKALTMFGHIDILINNGGISHRGSALSTNIQVDMKIMLVNYFGLVALTKAILPSMVERRSGHIVAISSIQGLIGIPHRSAYAASKHALQGFCDSLRAEVADQGVRVTVVSPGYIQTKLSVNALTGDGAQYGVVDAATAEGYQPEEVAEVVLRTVLEGRNERVVSTLSPRLAILLRHFAPWLYFRVMEVRARRFVEAVTGRKEK